MQTATHDRKQKTLKNMKKYGIFYGSQTGTTQEVANLIAAALGVAADDVHDVANTAPDKLADYDILVLGTSTWGDGEIEQDWYDFLDGAQSMDLKGKKMALFGVGDEGMTRTFCNGVAELKHRLRDTGAELIGRYTPKPYEFDHSDAVEDDGMAIGLLLDQTNRPELTADRIADWTKKIV